jgi:hypothetical protein
MPAPLEGEWKNDRNLFKANSLRHFPYRSSGHRHQSRLRLLRSHLLGAGGPLSPQPRIEAIRTFPA